MAVLSSFPPAEAPNAEARWRVLELPHGPDAPSHACTALRDELPRRLPRADADAVQRALNDALIVAGELILNAVEHGCADSTGSIRLGWRVADDHVWMWCADAGEADAISVGAVREEGLRGRGLAMVAAICDDWSVHCGRGTTVSARFPL